LVGKLHQKQQKSAQNKKKLASTYPKIYLEELLLA
jgi:hypothetical protein